MRGAAARLGIPSHPAGSGQFYPELRSTDGHTLAVIGRPVARPPVFSQTYKKRGPSGCPLRSPKHVGRREGHALAILRSTIPVHIHGRVPWMSGEDHSCPGRAPSRSRGSGNSHLHMQDMGRPTSRGVSIRRWSLAPGGVTGARQARPRLDCQDPLPGATAWAQRDMRKKMYMLGAATVGVFGFS